MNTNEPALAALRRFTRPRADTERCELCDQPLHPRHDHLVAQSKRELRCACAPCALLFDGTRDQTWRRAPERAKKLALRLDEPTWSRLGIPIGLAFFVRGDDEKVRAHFPGPAGATECEVHDDAWTTLLACSPDVAKLQPEIEALLVNRVRPRNDSYVVSIADGYALVGVLRKTWRGFSGGLEATEATQRFFDELEARCT